MSQAWQYQRERGSRPLISLLAWILRHLGRSVARLILWPLTLYFLVTGSTARRASRDYLRRVLEREPGLSDLLKHFYAFASVALDRALLPGDGGRQLQIEIHRAERVRELVESRQACLVLVSHLGSFEVLRVTGSETHRLPLRILMDRQIGAAVSDLLEELDPGFSNSIIDASQQGPSLVLALRDALDSGFSVGVMADRIRSGEPTTPVEFLGGVAQLPTSPWVLASVLRVPVLVAFGLYHGGNRYVAHFDVLAEQVRLPRQSREQALRERVQEYASLLEKRAREAPYNWFNFFDYWTQSEREPRAEQLPR